jgi:HAMP domain-containing protein
VIILFTTMKLAAKFNLILLAVFGLGFAATGYTAHRFLWSNAQSEVVRQARLMMETSSSSRTYTSQKIQPILAGIHGERDVFYAESVPAFAAISVFNNIRKTYPDYSYREATLNPTNPSDRAADWEADVINLFRNDLSKVEFIGERDTPSGRALFLAKPLRSVQECLTCHGLPGAAPAAMVRNYGTRNGFGWKAGEVIGAQIVSVPMAIPQGIASSAFSTLMLWLGSIAAVGLIMFNVVLDLAVILPVKRLSATADAISKGNLDVPELPVKGKDEVSALADSFNRMYRSLVKAIKMIEE